MNGALFTTELKAIAAIFAFCSAGITLAFGPLFFFFFKKKKSRLPVRLDRATSSKPDRCTRRKPPGSTPAPERSTCAWITRRGISSGHSNAETTFGTIWGPCGHFPLLRDCLCTTVGPRPATSCSGAAASIAADSDAAVQDLTHPGHHPTGGLALSHNKKMARIFPQRHCCPTCVLHARSGARVPKEILERTPPDDQF